MVTEKLLEVIQELAANEASKGDFVATVKEMRTAQKNYFKTRKKGFLFQSKDLEKKVDVMLTNLI